MRKSRIKNGFTLLEVMIALGIFAVGALVCLESYLINMKSVEAMEETETVLALAQRRIAEYELVPDEQKAGGGAFPPPRDEYAYELSFTDIPIGETEKLDFKIGRLAVTGPSARVEFLVPVLEKAEENELTD